MGKKKTSLENSIFRLSCIFKVDLHLKKKKNLKLDIILEVIFMQEICDRTKHNKSML